MRSRGKHGIVDVKCGASPVGSGQAGTMDRVGLNVMTGTIRSRSLRRWMLSGVSAALLAGSVADVSAGAFGIREQSTEAQGLAFAGTASGSGGVSSMFWNPPR